MAAIELEQGEGGDAFMHRLMTSEMIGIKPGDPFSPTFQVPQALACAASKRFQDLYHSKGGRIFASDDIVPMALSDQDSFWQTFIRWLYTSKLPARDTSGYFKMWQQAETLMAPQFMNRVLKMLSTECADIEFYLDDRVATLCAMVWKSANFAPDRKAGLELMAGEVYWGNKKRLLFMLDHAAWRGLTHYGVQTLYHHMDKNGVDKLVLTKRLLLVASGEIKGPPWAAENIHRYMTEESAFKADLAEIEAISAKRKSEDQLEGNERSKKPAVA